MYILFCSIDLKKQGFDWGQPFKKNCKMSFCLFPVGGRWNSKLNEQFIFVFFPSFYFLWNTGLETQILKSSYENLTDPPPLKNRPEQTEKWYNSLNIQSVLEDLHSQGGLFQGSPQGIRLNICVKDTHKGIDFAGADYLTDNNEFSMIIF